MNNSYYSFILDHPAQDVWDVIADFHNCEWSGLKQSAVLDKLNISEDIRASRVVLLGEQQIHQRLLARDDVEKSCTYENYLAGHRTFETKIQVRPVIETDKAFVEWFTSFAETASAEMIENFGIESATRSSISLRSFMASRNAERLLNASAKDLHRLRHRIDERRARLRIVV
jgi:hypothetical protein